MTTLQMRYAVAARDGGVCQAARLTLDRYQLAGPVLGQLTDYCERQQLQIHHVLPRRIGGRDELDNLVLLCASHHRLAHEVLRRGYSFLRDFLEVAADWADAARAAS